MLYLSRLSVVIGSFLVMVVVSFVVGDTWFDIKVKKPQEKVMYT